MLIDDFAQATGLDRRAADALVKDQRVEGVWRLDGQVFGIYDDALPTQEELRSWGLSVREDYDPEAHRSFDDTDDEADASDGESG